MNSTNYENVNLKDIYVIFIIIFSSIACLCSLGLCLRFHQYCTIRYNNQN